MIATVLHWFNGITRKELRSEWPWRDVKAWHEHIRTLEFRQHLPAYQAMADFRNANRGKNGKIANPLDLMWDGYKPAGMARSGREQKNHWSPAVVASFERLLKRGQASNALLSALGANDLRASGWKG